MYLANKYTQDLYQYICIYSDAIEACKEIWESRSVKVPPTDCVVTILTMVLKKNNFTFNGDHYLQINGTAMGTKITTSYANISMGKFEKNNCSNRLLKGRFLGTGL